jgi:hypothetical protein
MSENASKIPLNDSRNWTEDYEHENGHYMCRCCDCKRVFFGHKRRVVCRDCAKTKESNMSGGPIAQESIVDGLMAHMAASLGVDTSNPEETEGLRQMALAAVDYFGASVRGAPEGGGQTLLWAIFSALWEGQVDQNEINEFFSRVRVDPASMLWAWRGLKPEERKEPHSIVLVPGKLSTADIGAVTAALFHARGEK